jgi:microcystin degradation protein MlrC
MRIALIHIGQETNDFNPVPTTLRDFESFGLFEGDEVLQRQQDLGQIGGHLQAVRDSGLDVQTVPLIRAWATAGGRITRECFELFQRKIADGLRAAGPIDGLALQLHGACSAEGIDDVEGEQVALCSGWTTMPTSRRRWWRTATPSSATAPSRTTPSTPASSARGCCCASCGARCGR